MPTLPPRLFPRLVVAAALALAGLLALLPWWRNHALLLDFFDYGLVMAAVGRIGLGDRPYVDFSTPIQTLEYLPNALAEHIWGPHYLSLTYANGFFIVAALLGLFALLRRPLGRALALAVSTAIVVASATQHTIVWYNALGTVWLAIVVWVSAATAPAPGRRTAGRLMLVWAALWLGGMTKLTYQVAALAFATTFALRDGLDRHTSWRDARLKIYGYVLFGVIAPIATEMAYTGAGLAAWLENVVIGPAQFRAGMLGPIATWRFYLETPHNYYPPLYLPFVGAAGTVLLALLAGLCGRDLRRVAGRSRAGFAALGILVLGAWVSGVVLLATNMDIAYLSGAAWLVLATGLVIAFPTADSPQPPWPRRLLLGAAAIGLLVPAWISAWDGARAVWGREARVRPALVSTDDLPADFAYLRGMRIPPTLHASLVSFIEKRAAFTAQGVREDDYYFTNATEWMGRIMPAARHRGLPLWLAAGTTLSEADAWRIGARLETDPHTRVIVSYEGWSFWYPGLDRTLRRRFYESSAPPRIRFYLRRDLPEPVEFAINTHSNVFLGGMKVRGGVIEQRVAANGLFYAGGNTPHRIDFDFGLYRFSGEMVGELMGAAIDRPIAARFCLYAREGTHLTEKLWEEHLELSSATRALSRKFAISPGGRPVSLVLHLPAGVPANFGWRALQTEHAGTEDDRLRWPMNPELARQSIDAITRRALFAPGEDAGSLFAFGASPDPKTVADAPAWDLGAPSEIWLHLPAGRTHLVGECGVRLRPLAPKSGGVRVCVIACKGGRFDVEKQWDWLPDQASGDTQWRTFDAWVPEGVGWIGLIVQPLSRSRAATETVRWQNLRPR